MKKKINLRIKDELIESSKQLNQIISRLKTKVINGEGIDIIDKKGGLLRPVKGNLLNKFGRKKDGKYNTYTVYNGINIQTNKGSPVRSVFEGKVLYTGILEGYGNIIIIGHGMNYHSLYGHLDEIISSTGKSVRGGQIIGRSGDTGSLLGESLYFEMRHNGKPIEPTAWLSKSKTK
jgi:septal ring factor EnvC (AmiA/AmiB activator)